MVRVKGKRPKKKGKTNSKSNAKKILKKMKETWKVMSTSASTPTPAPLTEPVQASAFSPAMDTSGTSTQVKDRDIYSSNGIPGFIFLCNGKTKPECFQYRVFGLPMSQKESVEKIMPGTKLFLFDFELRLLYGVYEAASEGKIDLEPTAFEGRYSAQVKFRIVKECLPLLEKSFKSAIKDNYQGAKFRQELSESQVKRLVSMFRSLSSSSSKRVALPLPNTAPTQAMLSLRMEDHYKHSIRLHSDPYLAGMQQSHSLRMVEHQPIQTVQIMEHQHRTAGALVDHVHPSFPRQTIPNPMDSYNAHSQGLYFIRGHTQFVQEPYPKYSSLQEGVPQYHTVGLGSDYRPLPLWSKPLRQGHHPPQQENDVQYHHQLPLSRERETALNRESVAAYASVSTTYNVLSTLQPYASAYERPELTYSVPGAYVSTTVQRHAPASGRPEQTYSLPTGRYFSSIMQPYAPVSERPKSNISESSYHSLAGANQVIR